MVPSVQTGKQNLVNGVSDFARNSHFANFAVVAGIDLRKILTPESSMEESLHWLGQLERKVFDLTNSYKVPGNRIEDFINASISSGIPVNTYPFEVFPFQFGELLPPDIIQSLREGLMNFSGKIKGFKQELCWAWKAKHLHPCR